MSFQSAWARLAGLLSSAHSDADFDEEIAGHLQMAADEWKAAGMDERQALRQARIHFGGTTQAREAYRNQRGLPSSNLHLVSSAARPVFSLLRFQVLQSD